MPSIVKGVPQARHRSASMEFAPSQRGQMIDDVPSAPVSMPGGGCRRRRRRALAWGLAIAGLDGPTGRQAGVRIGCWNDERCAQVGQRAVRPAWEELASRMEPQRSQVRLKRVGPGGGDGGTGGEGGAPSVESVNRSLQ